jgi:hypothetical protein
MKPRRRLALKREHLADLGTDDLRHVVGGTHIGCVTHGNTCDFCDIPTLPVNYCIVVNLTDACIDLTRACIWLTEGCQ